MERDIHQKMKAVKLFWEWGFFPEIDVRLFHTEGLTKAKMEMTDFDVLGIRISNELKEERISADCKTAKNTSPINRAFWLKGLMSHLDVERGFLILSKKAALDHKLAAKKLNINLMDDQEFDTFSSNLINNSHLNEMSIIKPQVWTNFHSRTSSIPEFSRIWDYRKYRYWQDSHQRQIRYCLLEMRQAARFVKQKNPIITAMFLDVLSLFSLSLSSMSASLFQSHFIFESEKELDISLKSYVYDGRENYEHLNSLTQRVLSMKRSLESEDNSRNLQDNQFLSLPAWNNFKNLIMNLLSNPRDASLIPMILKFVLYERLLERSEVKLNKVIKNVSPLSLKLALDVLSYYSIATDMPRLIWEPIYSELEDLILNFQNELFEETINSIKNTSYEISEINTPIDLNSSKELSKSNTLQSNEVENDPESKSLKIDSTSKKSRSSDEIESRDETYSSQNQTNKSANTNNLSSEKTDNIDDTLTEKHESELKQMSLFNDIPQKPKEE